MNLAPNANSIVVTIHDKLWLPASFTHRGRVRRSNNSDNPETKANWIFHRREQTPFSRLGCCLIGRLVSIYHNLG
jgi:hypothetical protein